jgi:hypothetical protein
VGGGTGFRATQAAVAAGETSHWGEKVEIGAEVAALSS